MSMTDAEIREALARAERATCSCHIEITRVHGFPQGHRSDCARTDVPRLVATIREREAEIERLRGERDELRDSHESEKTALVHRAMYDQIKRERDEARAAHESERRVYGEDVRINAARAETAEAEVARLGKELASVRGRILADEERLKLTGDALQAEARCLELEQERDLAYSLRNNATGVLSDICAHRDSLAARCRALEGFVRGFLHASSGTRNENAAALLSRLETRAQVLLSPPPSPEATPFEADTMTHEEAKCATCGGSGGVSRIEAVGHDEYGDLVGEAVSEPCPDCHGCGGGA